MLFPTEATRGCGRAWHVLIGVFVFGIVQIGSGPIVPWLRAWLQDWLHFLIALPLIIVNSVLSARALRRPVVTVYGRLCVPRGCAGCQLTVGHWSCLAVWKVTNNEDTRGCCSGTRCFVSRSVVYGVSKDRGGFMFKEPRSSYTFCTLKMKAVHFVEVSEATHAALQYIPEEMHSQKRRSYFCTNFKGVASCGWIERFLNARDFCTCSRIAFTESPSVCSTTSSASLASLTSLLPQSRDCSCYVSRPILARPPPCIQKHTDLRAHHFAQSHVL